MAIYALPKTGDVIVFNKCPPGSWVSVGETYFVKRWGHTTFQFRNVKTGGGTFDRLWAVQLADFTIVRSDKEGSVA